MSEKSKKGCLTRTIITGLLVVVGMFCLALFTIVLLFGSAIGSTAGALSDSSMAKKGYQSTILEEGKGKDIVLVIEVNTVITAHKGISERLIEQIRYAAKEKNVKAVVLNLNTPGGEVVATDEIHREIQKLRSETKKPVIACMHSVAASGGYYLAAGSDYIVANKLTITGSIGVIISSYNMHELFKKIGVKPEVYKSGDMKDILSPGRDLNSPQAIKQAELVQRMVKESFHEFATVVHEGRKIPLAEVKAPGIGDARIMSGREAKEKNLVDELGYFEDAVRVAKQRAGVPNAFVVRLDRVPNLKDIIFGIQKKVDQNAISESLKEVMVLKPGRMYYLAPGYF